MIRKKLLQQFTAVSFFVYSLQVFILHKFLLYFLQILHDTV